MSFLSRGFDQVEKDVQEQTDRRERMMARRVYIKANSSINAIFLDEEPVCFEEYRLWKGNRPDFVTRPPQGQKDRFLAKGLKADKKYAWTVIDCTKWKDRKGQEHGPERKLLVVGPDVAKMLRDKKASWGGLKHKAVVIRRKGDKDSASGSDFELVMQNGAVVTPKMSVFKDDQKTPFDYEKVLAPPSDDESIRLLALYAKAQDNTSAIPVDEEDPGSGHGDALPDGGGQVDNSMSDVPF